MGVAACVKVCWDFHMAAAKMDQSTVRELVNKLERN